MRKCFLTFAILLLSVAAAEATQPGPYQKLDPKKLTDTLRSLQMTELLGEVLGQQPASAAAAAGGEMALAAEKVKLAEATNDPAQRDRLLQEALDIYRKIGAEKPNSDDDLWNRVFEARLRFVDASRLRARPLAIRLMYLQGAEEDRKTVVAMTDEAIKVFNTGLKAAVDDTLRDYRSSTDKTKYVMYLRTATQIKGRLVEVGAYLRLYRGMALPDGSNERKTLLNQLISSMEEYTKADDEEEGKYPACLLSGMALRELGQHEQAATMLTVAASEKAPPEIRLQAMFEIIHNLTEMQKYEQVPGEVDRFRKAALAVLGDSADSRLRVDVQAALLLDDLYEHQAEGAKDPARQRDLRGQAQKALLDFLKKYPSPDISSQFLDVVGWKYRDRADRKNLSAIVLVALARIEKARHTEEGNAEALQLLDRASDANDAVSAQAFPYVLRESATLQYQMKRPREAGRSFFRLAGLTPDANEAFPFALNSVICFYNAYDEAAKAKAPRADLQDELLAALNQLTARWSAHPDTGPWFFVLGKIESEKAQSYGARSPERTACLRRAVEAFERTPANLPESGSARFRALEVRLRMLREDPKAADVKSQAEALVAKMKAYADDARKAQAAATDKDLAEQWGDWGSRAAVGAIQVRYEFLGDRDASLKDLEKVLTDWKGSSVAREAMDWQIRMLVESADPAKIAEAIAKVDAFRKQYPQEADGLIHQVVERIQERIRTVRQDPDGAAELGRLTKAYIDFAKELYDRSAKVDPNQLYGTRQMYADALWLSGEGERSLKLWQQCAAEDAARGEAQGKAIDAEIDRRTRPVREESTRRNEAELERCAQDYIKFLADKKLPQDSGYVSNIREALKLMKMPSDPDEHDRRMVAVVNRILDGYKAAGAALKKQTQVDAMNWLGQARAHRMLKQYPDAMKFYNQLSKGIDRQTFGDFFWDVQLELCQTAREGFGADKKQMGDLAQYIRLLRADAPEMGGKLGQFNQIENDAKKASE